jgi:hypothetical protein
MIAPVYLLDTHALISSSDNLLPSYILLMFALCTTKYHNEKTIATLCCRFIAGI